MILILSRTDDYDTNLVIEWLRFYKIPFFRLNDEELMNGLTKLKYFNNEIYLSNDLEIKLNEIKVVWFRKFGFLTDFEND